MTMDLIFNIVQLVVGVTVTVLSIAFRRRATRRARGPLHVPRALYLAAPPGDLDPITLRRWRA